MLHNCQMFLALALVTASMGAAGCTAAQTQDVIPNGVYEGTGYQFNNDGTWTISVNVETTRYYIDYPSLDCGGTLAVEVVSQADQQVEFRETIAYGTCVDNGLTILTLTDNEGELDFKWYFDSGEFGSDGLLVLQ